jgi:hypothetical protein
MNPPNTPSKSEPGRIPDFICEQDLASLAKNRDELLTRANSWLEANVSRGQDDWEFQAVRAQSTAALMAEEMAAYFEAAANSPHQSDSSVAYLNRLAGYGRQLEALALGELQHGID